MLFGAKGFANAVLDFGVIIMIKEGEWHFYLPH